VSLGTGNIGRAVARILVFAGMGCTMAEMLKIEFTPLAGVVPLADRLRLATGENGSLLVVSKRARTPPIGAATTFSALDMTIPRAAWSEVVRVQEVVPAELNWDVAISNGQTKIVHEKPGGATNSLSLWTASGSSQALTREYPMQSFSEPRFVKASQPPGWVTAIVDNRTCVALSLVRAEPYRKLGECAAGLLVQNGIGFAFVYKTGVPGPARGNGISPGRIHLASLDAQLRSSGPATVVFEGVVFEFDADVIGDKLVVVATTPKGIVVAVGPAQRTAVRLVAEEHAIPTVLTSPAIGNSGSGKALVAALDSGGPAAARVFIADLTVP
jgi:hypothetical protein